MGEDRTIPVDVRILAATHADLPKKIAAGEFREDLYYRLHVLQIHLPPLSQRREDIIPLAEHFAHRSAERFGMEEVRISQGVLKQLAQAPWPEVIEFVERRGTLLLFYIAERFLAHVPT